MDAKLKEYEKTIKTKHSFHWTPKHIEVFQTHLKKPVFIPVVIKTFEKLTWDLVFQDETSAEAKRNNERNSWTEKITVTYSPGGNVEVKSVSLGNEMWDAGRNSKRVRLFIHAFKEMEKELDQKALDELERETERQNNLDDYEIPQSLPQPKKRLEPQIAFPIIGGLAIALILGYALAFLSFKVGYIIGLFEVGVALAMGFSFSYFIRFGNYTDYQKLQYVLIASIIITYVSNQYFLYLLILRENNFEAIGFFEFIKIRLSEGLTIKSLNTGWIGLIISWIFQLVFTYFFVYFKIISSLTSYKLERIPSEVLDFTYYHFNKGKTEDQVRHELSKMGWKDVQDQNEAIESIVALIDAQTLRRME